MAMALNIILPLLICLVGAVVYAASSNATAKELGRGAYWCGMLVTLMSLASAHLRLG